MIREDGVISLRLSTATTEDKWNVLQTFLMLDCLLSFFLFALSFSISERWGGGAFLQLVTTGAVQLLFSVYVLGLVRQQDLSAPSSVSQMFGMSFSVDFMGGAGIALCFLLFQTVFLWHGFGTGLGFTKLEKQGEAMFTREQFPSGGAERACSFVASLCLVINVGLFYVIYLWKEELLQDTGGGAFNWSNQTKVEQPGQGINQASTSMMLQRNTGAESYGNKAGLEEEVDDFEHYQSYDIETKRKLNPANSTNLF